MTCDLESVPCGRVFRVARRPDPWAYPDWADVGQDGTFGNRFDDPESSYRVLYACSQRLGTFIETLARFRPDPEVVAGLQEIDGEDDGALSPGEVPSSWADERLIGEGSIQGAFADVGHGRSLSYLRTVLASRLVHYGIPDLDGAAIRLSAPRRFTQEMSRLVFECTDSESGRSFAGVRYLSRLGDELQNWAVFEPLLPDNAATSPIRLDDDDLRTALDRLHLRLV